ncbi:hypothetical protein Pmani_025109 [Petrolisthes manimaculis]|uniref:Uncharacterized protein n=1 Tax=Petrolisthes manimaculis TaxID=1843537 RepID=A0AAE1TYN3_9EUCA|nr:hypothetical protein Pmani_025109 [Petrolisthes manimaculis]
MVGSAPTTQHHHHHYTSTHPTQPQITFIAVVALCGGCGETAVVGARDQGDEGQLWAILVAGSTGWFNYRHQVTR